MRVGSAKNDGAGLFFASFAKTLRPLRLQVLCVPCKSVGPWNELTFCLDWICHVPHN